MFFVVLSSLYITVLLIVMATIQATIQATNMFSANDGSNGVNVAMAYNQSSMKITFSAQSTVVIYL